MIQLQSLADIERIPAGEQITFTALVSDIKQQVTSTNKTYARIYLRDDKNATSVPLWDTSLDTAKEMYTVDEIYSFGAITDSYQGKTTIKKIISATVVTDPAITRKLKQFMFKHAVDANVELIYSTIDKLKDTKYYYYLLAIYGEDATTEKAAYLKTAFASINHHDNYPGGFINHIGGMLRIATQLRATYITGRCESLWDVDWKFIMAAILLHDIGKLQTYSNVTPFMVRFKDSCKLDHNKIGVGMLYQIHNILPQDKQLDEVDFQQVAYTICYHDTLEKLYEHKRLEDKLISYIDGLEATLACSCSLEV